MLYHQLLLTLPFVLLVSAPLSAERAPLSPKQKDAESTHVVTGKVLGVYSRDVDSKLYGKGTIVERIIIEIEVTSVEKGKRVQRNDVIYARCWKLKRRGAAGAEPGPGGHFSIPKEGDEVHAFLAQGAYSPTGQTDSGFAVVYRNGIEIKKKARGRREAK